MELPSRGKLALLGLGGVAASFGISWLPPSRWLPAPVMEGAAAALFFGGLGATLVGTGEIVAHGVHDAFVHERAKPPLSLT